MTSFLLPRSDRPVRFEFQNHVVNVNISHQNSIIIVFLLYTTKKLINFLVYIQF